MAWDGEDTHRKRWPCRECIAGGQHIPNVLLAKEKTMLTAIPQLNTYYVSIHTYKYIHDRSIIHIGMCILVFLVDSESLVGQHQVVGPLTDEGFVQVQLKSSKASYIPRMKMGESCLKRYIIHS